MESKVVVKKVPVEGKEGLYSIIIESTYPKSMSISEITKILEKPLPNLSEKPKASANITSE